MWTPSVVNCQLNSSLLTIIFHISHRIIIFTIKKKKQNKKNLLQERVGEFNIWISFLINPLSRTKIHLIFAVI